MVLPAHPEQRFPREGKAFVLQHPGRPSAPRCPRFRTRGGPQRSCPRPHRCPSGRGAAPRAARPCRGPFPARERSPFLAKHSLGPRVSLGWGRQGRKCSSIAAPLRSNLPNPPKARRRARPGCGTGSVRPSLPKSSIAPDGVPEPSAAGLRCADFRFRSPAPPPPGPGLSLGVSLCGCAVAPRVTGGGQNAAAEAGQGELVAMLGWGWKGKELGSTLSRELLTQQHPSSVGISSGSQSSRLADPGPPRATGRVTRDAVPVPGGNALMPL